MDVPGCFFGISRKTGYKWLERYATSGPTGLRDRSYAFTCSSVTTPRAPSCAGPCAGWGE